jgi:hypothetical protein
VQLLYETNLDAQGMHFDKLNLFSDANDESLEIRNSKQDIHMHIDDYSLLMPFDAKQG